MTTRARSSNEQKHESANPVLRGLVARFHARATRMVADPPFADVLDVGCGEGYFARALLDAFPGIALHGIDTSERAIALARSRCPGATFDVRDAMQVADEGRRFDLVVCTEVLEHVASPEPLLDALARASRDRLLVTVPWEPWFRWANFARGKYVRRFGNHPGHVNAWSPEGFERFVASRVDVVGRATSFPWTLVLARVR